MICKHVLLITFLHSQSSFLHTVKWFQVLLSITNNSSRDQTFVYTQLNDQTALFPTIPCPDGWGCKIRRLLLCRGVRTHPQRVS